MIEVQDLHKDFGTTHAVDGVTFNLDAGEILGFLGPNGAGKTTTMRIITCYLPPTSGTVLVDGLDVTQESLQVRKKIGYLPESAPLYLDMNVVDYLRFIAEVRGIPSTQRRGALHNAVDVCGLGDVLQKNVGQLSSGYKQRVGLAQAILHDPEILVLDEPTRGLDPNQIEEIRSVIRELGQHKTVIFSTHILQEVQAVCKRVVIINDGRLTFDGSKDSFGTAGLDRVVVEMRAATEAAEQIERIEDVQGVQVLSREDGLLRLRVESASGHDVREKIFSAAVQHGWVLLELRRETRSLEDVFREYTKNRDHSEN